MASACKFLGAHPQDPAPERGGDDGLSAARPRASGAHPPPPAARSPGPSSPPFPDPPQDGALPVEAAGPSGTRAGRRRGAIGPSEKVSRLPGSALHRSAAARLRRSLIASPRPLSGIGLTAMVVAPDASRRLRNAN